MYKRQENGWVELNATADGLTANAIPKGQEVLIVIGEGLENCLLYTSKAGAPSTVGRCARFAI